MTQDERWMSKYNEVKTFIEVNRRNPSRYDAEDGGLYRNWIRHNKKLLNSGVLKQERFGFFNNLLALMEKNKRINQWT